MLIFFYNWLSVLPTTSMGCNMRLEHQKQANTECKINYSRMRFSYRSSDVYMIRTVGNYSSCQY